MALSLAQRVLGAAGYTAFRSRPFEVDGATHARISPQATFAPWLSDTRFREVYRHVQRNTLVDELRCYELWQLVQQVRHLPGDVLEVGVWRGGTGALIAAATEKPVYLVDTFSGVVKAGAADLCYKGGEHSDTCEETVRQLLRDVGADASILRGTYPDDFPDLLGPYCFVHIDVDTQRSARDILEAVWPQMPTGGIVVFDDYGFQWCSGIPPLVDSLRCRPGCIVLHNLNGHAVLVKTA